MKTKRTFVAKAQRFVCGLFAAVALLLTSCNKDIDEGTPYIKLSPSTDAIAFSADAIESYGREYIRHWQSPDYPNKPHPCGRNTESIKNKV